MNLSKTRDSRCWKKWRNSGALSIYALDKERSKAERTTPWHQLVHNVIDEAVGNWTQRHFKTPDPKVKAVLLKYANAIANKVLEGDTPCPDFSPTWKSDVSNRVFDLLKYDDFKKEQIPILVLRLWNKFGDTTKNFENDLWGYSMAKIANGVGVVTYMEKVGLDPEILVMTPEEANMALLKMAARLSVTHPDKLIIADPTKDSVQDVVSEVLLRTNPPDISQYLPK